MTVLKKLFIKDYKNLKDPSVRVKYGIVASVFGIVTNLLLFLLKILIGMLSGSITIIADAINNFLDSASSVITLLGFNFASRPADKEHPYGHARYEYVASFLVSILILLVGFVLFGQSIDKMANPNELKIELITYIVLVLSIVFKVLQIVVYNQFGKEINSNALFAASVDARNDIIITIGVIATAMAASFGLNIDGMMGLGISLFIMFSSVILIKDNISVLIGQAPSAELVESIRKHILSFRGVLGVHDLTVHLYGENNVFVAADVEICSSTSLMQAHLLADKIEKSLGEQLGVNAILHVDPVCDHKDAKTLQKELKRVIEKINPLFNIHDFRVSEEHEIDFHLEIPFNTKETEDEIVLHIVDAFKFGQYKLIIKIDRV